MSAAKDFNGVVMPPSRDMTWTPCHRYAINEPATLPKKLNSSPRTHWAYAWQVGGKEMSARARLATAYGACVSAALVDVQRGSSPLELGRSSRRRRG